MTELRCPKDQAPLRSYERNGITIERCGECGGIFLDRGELERLLAAESEHLDRGPGEYGRGRSEDERHYGQGERRRRRSWLGDLLDFD